MGQMGPCGKVNILATEDTLHGTERAPAEWDTVFANHVSDEELISRVSGELLKARHKTDVIYKWAKYLNEHFSGGGVCTGSGHLQGQATVPPPLTPAAWHCHVERDQEHVLVRTLLLCPHLKSCCVLCSPPVPTQAPSHLCSWTTMLSCP